MKRRLGLAAVWAAATLTTGALALAVVRVGGGAFSEDAVQPLSVSEVEALAASSTAVTAAEPAGPTGSSATTLVAQPADPESPSTTGAPAAAAEDPSVGSAAFSSSTSSTPSAPTSTAPPTTSALPSSTTTTAPGSTTTSSSAASPTTTEADGPDDGDEVAAPGGSEVVEAFAVEGGTVLVRWSDSSVRLVSAAPEPGFGVEVKKDGPDEVVVEFEGTDIEVRFHAELSDGELVVRSESSGD